MPQGNISMLGEGGGGAGAAPIFGRNAVGGAAPAPAGPQMQQDQSGMQALQMAKLIRDIQAQNAAKGGGGGASGGMMSGKSGGNGAAAQGAADSIGTMGGGM